MQQRFQLADGPQRNDRYADTFKQQMAQLGADADWRKLSDAQREKLVGDHHLESLKPVELATPAQLQDALDDCSLQHWIARIEALPSRFEAARKAAVKLLKPNVVHVAIPRRTLNDDSELKSWLAEVEALLSQAVQKGPVSL